MKKLLVLLAILVALACAGVWVSASRKAPQPIVLPNPNGYDDFKNAAGSGIGVPENLELQTTQVLSKLIESQREPLALARSGLQKECRVPLTNSTAYLQTHLEELAGFKALARLLQAEGVLAEKEGRRASAMRSYVDLIRFGEELGRGGLIVDGLVGIACQKIGVNALYGLHQKLPATECMDAIKTLQNAEAALESIDEILFREREFSRRSAGWQFSIIKIVRPKVYAGVEQKFRSAFETTAIARRRLMVDLAARAFEAERGKRPEGFSDLVPNYLAEAPIDPSTGKELIYAWR